MTVVENVEFFTGKVFNLIFNMRTESVEVVIAKDEGNLVTLYMSLTEFDYKFNPHHSIFKFLCEHIMQTHYRFLRVEERWYPTEEPIPPQN